MSTPDPKAFGLPDPTSVALPTMSEGAVPLDATGMTEAMSTVLAAVPDAAVLARMANEMFRALPSTASTPEAALAWMPAGVPATDAVGASPPNPRSAVLAPVAVPSSPSPMGAPLPAVPGLAVDPTIPGSIDAAAFARLPWAAAAPYTSEADVKDLAALAAAALSSAAAMPSVGAMPSMGATPGVPAMPSASSFYFLDTSLPLAPTVGAFEVTPEIVPALTETRGIFDAHAIRRDFPILDQQIHGKSLIWLDNAATTQKPRVVIDRISTFYERENSNIHRAAHALAARATDAYEAARETVRRFLGAGSTREIVFVRGATEGINLVSQSWGRRFVGEGDEIILTRLEHHSNIVPWQMLCSEKGARIKVAPIDDSGQILLDEYERLFTPRTRLVAFTQVSNALGTVTPAREMVEIAHRHGARALVDGAQAVSHMRVDVQALDCDFYVFSGHKVFGPTGIGVVYGKEEVLAATPPWQGGGNMITDVTFEKTVYQPPPMRFEAGTGNIADAVGLGAALEYLMGAGLENVSRHEHELLVHATKGLLDIPGLRLIGTARDKAGVLSFVLDGFRSEDVGKALDAEGIAVRSGHHCAQPALRRFGLESSVRPSLALYNTCEDVDALLAALHRLTADRPRRG